jgi:hypothetical protein
MYVAMGGDHKRNFSYLFNENDIVGCGVTSNGWVYFTNNGKFCGFTGRNDIPSGRNVYAVIGLSSPQTVAHLNVGKHPFLYAFNVRSPVALSLPIASNAFAVVENKRGVVQRVIELHTACSTNDKANPKRRARYQLFLEAIARHSPELVEGAPSTCQLLALPPPPIQKLDIDDADIHVTLIHEAMNQGEFRRSLAHIDDRPSWSRSYYIVHFMRGWILYRGLGGPVNMAEARTCFENAAGRYRPAAGMLLMLPNAKIDAAAARDLYGALMRLNNDEWAFLTAGWMTEKGVGTDKNAQKAVEFYEQAATLGNVDGMFLAGRGNLIARKDKERGRFYLKEAADRRHLAAMLFLAANFSRRDDADGEIRQGLVRRAVMRIVGGEYSALDEYDNMSAAATVRH